MLVRLLAAVVGVSFFTMNNIGHHLALCCGIALQFVGNHVVRRTALALQQPVEEALRRLRILSFLHENIDGIAVLVDRAPKVPGFAVDCDDMDFVQEPDIAQTPSSFAKAARIDWAEANAPDANGFVAHGDAALCQQIFNVAKAQAEAVVGPRGVTDHFGWKATAINDVEFFIAYAASGKRLTKPSLQRADIVHGVR